MREFILAAHIFTEEDVPEDKQGDVTDYILKVFNGNNVYVSGHYEDVEEDEEVNELIKGKDDEEI